MSFFGFQQSFDLEKERNQFLEGGLRQEEDVAVYKAKNAFEGVLDYLDECHEKQIRAGLNLDEAMKAFPL